MSISESRRVYGTFARRDGYVRFFLQKTFNRT